MAGVLLLSGSLLATAYQSRRLGRTPPVIPTLMPTLALNPAATEVSALPPTRTAVPSPSPPPTATPAPTATPVPPTATPDPPTATPVPPTATPDPPTATPVPPTATPDPPTATPDPPTATPDPPTVTPDPAASPAPPPVPTLSLVPGAPHGYLDRFRLVSYYGSPTGPGLGILGELPRDDMLALLRQQAAAYQPFSPERTILPTFHMIVTVASPNPPYYYNAIDLALIEEWIAAAAAAGVAVVLDIQPGQGDVLYIYQRVRHLLVQPHVHLAIDPEFAMGPGQVPGISIGSLGAAVVNAVQQDLNQIGVEIGLNRVLILHQFADMMLPDKGDVVDYPFVELVIDGDGVGSPAAKIRNYNQYATEPAFEYGGFKLFPTDGDYPVLSPAEVMSVLEPPPVIIIYQ